MARFSLSKKKIRTLSPYFSTYWREESKLEIKTRKGAEEEIEGSLQLQCNYKYPYYLHLNKKKMLVFNRNKKEINNKITIKKHRKKYICIFFILFHGCISCVKSYCSDATSIIKQSELYITKKMMILRNKLILIFEFI